MGNDALQGPATIRAGFFDKDIFKARKRLILVLETSVAGLAHYVDVNEADGRKLVGALEPGTELRLFREADNEHDRWAVAVYTADNHKLGFLPRFKNETVARLMDNGKVFRAFVVSARVSGTGSAEADNSARPGPAPTENSVLPLSVYMED